jgi:hypothetical protein
LSEPTLQLPGPTETRDESIARLCRQLCLCRTRGQLAEASRLEIALRERLSDGLSQDAVQEIFLTEQKRVIDALMLAEVLGPFLTDRLASAASEKSRAPAVAPPRGPSRSAPASDRQPAIADLIEGMLVQERAARDHAA